MMKTVALWIASLLASVAQGQFQYRFDQSIPVTVNDQSLSLAWAGGLNGVQVNTLDLNGDNKPDLVLYERQADKILTFINTGSEYQYRPEYEEFFPDDVSQWLLLRDLNCDGRKDLFTREPLGINVYLNITTPGQPLRWREFNKGFTLLTEGLNGNTNIQLGFDDIPAIDDVDGDGDLDILNFRFFGSGTVEYHQNQSVERTGQCDSLQMKRITTNYGGFEECSCGRIAFGQTCAQLGGGRTEHAVGRVLLNLDLDQDGDREILFSEQNCARLYLLTNQGTPQVAVMNGFTTFPAVNPLAILTFPAPFSEDVTFDGVADLTVSPNIYSRDNVNNNFQNSLWLYTNTGTNAAPQYTFTRSNFLQEKMIDVGDNSVPAFFDADGDGDLDLFVGTNGDNNFRGSIKVFENTGNTSQPEFKLVNEDFQNLSFAGYYNVKPQFADMNNDGKTDLVFTGTRTSNGTTSLLYIPNQINVGLNFSNQEITFVGFSLSPSRVNDNILVTDVNLDGLADLLVGTSLGAVEYWRNVGQAGSPLFARESTTFLGIGSSTDRQSPALAQADVTGDGKTDLVMGDQRGRLTIYPDFRGNGSTSMPVSIFNEVSQNYTAKNLGGRIWPTTANLTATSTPLIVVGNTLGGLHVLRSEGSVDLPEQPELTLYPNPADVNGVFFARSDRDGLLQFYNLLGQPTGVTYSLRAFEPFLFAGSGLASGLYIARFSAQGKSASQRLLIR